MLVMLSWSGLPPSSSILNCGLLKRAGRRALWPSLIAALSAACILAEGAAVFFQAGLPLVKPPAVAPSFCRQCRRPAFLRQVGKRGKLDAGRAHLVGGWVGSFGE